MFGDVGHGGILLVVGILACLLADTDLFKGALKPMRDSRYLILLLGVFSFFCGFMYNDMMALPLEVFGPSCYTVPHENAFGNHVEKSFTPKPDCVYKAGLDHSWYEAENELVYFNSMKMKISVILGVAQMSLGIFLKAMNSIYFKKPIDFLFEFIPQITLLTVLFGYMCLLIIVKWITPWPDTSQAPSIIGFMIKMFLGVGAVEGTPLIGDVAFNTALN